MQKEKLLSELYNGNLCPIAKEVVHGSKYQINHTKMLWESIEKNTD